MDAEGVVRAFNDEDRKALQSQLALAHQKIRSATLLWSSDQFADGLRMACEGLRESLAAVELMGTVVARSGSAKSTPARWDEVLAQMGVPPEDIEAAQKAERRARPEAMPRLDSEVEAEHETLFGSLIARATSTASRVRRLTTPRRRLVVRWWLWGGAAGALAVVLAIFALISRKTGPLEATASAHYGNDPRFSPRNILDNNLQTEWLAPTSTAAWIEVTAGGASIKTLKLRNGRNPPHNDRAIIDFHVECYRDGKVVHTTKATFGPFDAKQPWLRVPLNQTDVERVRVVVDKWHTNGAALAELAWE